MILCGSRVRPPSLLGPGPLVRLASEADCPGLAIDEGCLLPEVRLVGLEALKVGLALGVVRAPLPEAKLPAQKRLPHLASRDRDERKAAVALVRRALETSRDLGAKLVVLDFGHVTLVSPEPAVRLHFSRRALGDGEPGKKLLEAALAERRALGPSLLDACRSAFEPLLKAAESFEARLAILPAATPWQGPSPREALDLIREFSGGPAGVVWSPARLTVMATLGVTLPPERREALRAAAFLVEATDAVGLEHPLAPGLGEVDFTDLVPEGASTVMISGAPDTSRSELIGARVLVEQRGAALLRAPQAAGTTDQS